jgi:uncharacterized RDD family membrane protein YckC
VENNYSLVLTGETLQGFTPESVWPELATYFRIEPKRLERLLRRAPVAIKRNTTLHKANIGRTNIDSIGAHSEIYENDGRTDLYVVIDGTARGPIPRLMVDNRIEQGVWNDSIPVMEVGTDVWQPYSKIANPADTPYVPDVSDMPDTDDVFPPSQMPTLLLRSMLAAPTTGEISPSSRFIRARTKLPDRSLPLDAEIYSGFWKRFAAFVIDGTLLNVLFILIKLVTLNGLSTSAFVFIMIVCCWLYFSLMESSQWQATLGKRALKIKVTDSHGKRIGMAKATGRHFGKILSGAIFGIGFLFILWTKRKQALHDMMIDGAVVDAKVGPNTSYPIRPSPMPWYGWVLVLLGVFPIPFGIFSAIGWPVYEEYTVRVRIERGLVLARAAQIAVAETFAAPTTEQTIANIDPYLGSGPASQNSYGFTFVPTTTVSSIFIRGMYRDNPAPRDGTIIITYSGKVGALMGDNNKIFLQPGSGRVIHGVPSERLLRGEYITWGCSVDSSQVFRYIPTACHNIHDKP